MKDRLIISGLEFHGHCGITEEEKTAGQRISVDIEIGCDIQTPGKTDQLKNALDYAAISHRLAEVGRKESFQLIEALAERLAEVLLKEFPVEEITLCLKKLHPPVEPIKNFAAVQIHRSI